MKKFLVTAAVAGLLIFGGQANVDAATADTVTAANVETQDMSGWTRLRDKVLGRDKYDRDRRDRRDWNRRDRDRRDYRDDDRRRHYPPPPPPPRRR